MTFTAIVATVACGSSDDFVTSEIDEELRKCNRLSGSYNHHSCSCYASNSNTGSMCR